MECMGNPHEMAISGIDTFVSLVSKRETKVSGHNKAVLDPETTVLGPDKAVSVLKKSILHFPPFFIMFGVDRFCVGVGF